MTTVGFVGLGNVGSKLAGSLLDNGIDVVVCDLDPEVVARFVERGARAADTPFTMAPLCDVIITALPSPRICSEVAEGGPDGSPGFLSAMKPGSLWMEMSTTDAGEVQRLGAVADQHGVTLLECPVSGGCHRAATGNISIFAGGSRQAFDRGFPYLQMLGRQILHTGELGSASVLKVVTNYLAAIHLAATGEAFAVGAKAGIDMTTIYHAVRISSGNSFSHETEGQLILNGSYDINFTMDLVEKDTDLFLDVAKEGGVDLELAPVLRAVFADAAERYGPRALSPRVVQRFEDDLGIDFRAPGFPAEIVDDEPKVPGHEVKA